MRWPAARCRLCCWHSWRSLCSGGLTEAPIWCALDFTCCCLVAVLLCRGSQPVQDPFLRVLTTAFWDARSSSMHHEPLTQQQTGAALAQICAAAHRERQAVRSACSCAQLSDRCLTLLLACSSGPASCQRSAQQPLIPMCLPTALRRSNFYSCSYAGRPCRCRAAQACPCSERAPVRTFCAHAALCMQEDCQLQAIRLCFASMVDRLICWTCCEVPTSAGTPFLCVVLLGPACCCRPC